MPLRLQYMAEIQTGDASLLLQAMQEYLLTKPSSEYC